MKGISASLLVIIAIVMIPKPGLTQSKSKLGEIKGYMVSEYYHFANITREMEKLVLKVVMDSGSVVFTLPITTS